MWLVKGQVAFVRLPSNNTPVIGTIGKGSGFNLLKAGLPARQLKKEMAMLKQLLTGAALSLLVLTPAMGQGTTPQTGAQTPSGSDFLQQQTSNELRATNLIEVPVWGANNQRIGSINDLLIDQNAEFRRALIRCGKAGPRPAGENRRLPEFVGHKRPSQAVTQALARL